MPVETESSDLHPNLRYLSHSALSTFHLCPRKFYLERMGAAAMANEQEEQTSACDLEFGTCVGIGTEMVLQNKKMQDIYLAMFLAHSSPMESEDDKVAKRKSKTFWDALVAVDRFPEFKSTALGNYNLVDISGVAGVELGFILDCGNGFVYRGKLDAMLIDKKEERLAVFENKTTGGWLHEANYQNSGQGVGYDLITDAISRQLGMVHGYSYMVNYSIWSTRDGDWVLMPFPQTHTNRARWIKSLLIDIKHITEYAEENFWPMNGSACMAFGRPCSYFGACTMSDRALLPRKIKLKQDKVGEYPFTFSLLALIEEHLESLGSTETGAS